MWIEKGLVNGSRGTLFSILWDRGVENPRDTIPCCLLVRFEDYRGDGIEGLIGQDRRDGAIIPIFPVRRARGNTSGETISEARYREQFPVIPCYAITIHKSQGMTLDQAVINLSERQVSPGAFYVALSRVRSLSGLAIERDFLLSDLRFPETDVTRDRNLDWNIRSTMLVLPSEVPPITPTSPPATRRTILGGSPLVIRSSTRRQIQRSQPYWNGSISPTSSRESSPTPRPTARRRL